MSVFGWYGIGSAYMADAFTIHGTEVPLSKLGSTGTMDTG